MLFPEEDAPLLKKWIVKRLENTSDADADVLADYILALLRHDGDITTVRTLCEAEIPDFLKEDSSIFVRDVFEAIQYKSYLTGAMAPRRSSVPSFAPPTGPFAHSYGSFGNATAAVGPQNGSRKRSYNDRGDGDSQDRGFQPGSADVNGRQYKQARRGGSLGRGSFDKFGNGRGGFSGRPSPPNLHGISAQVGFPNMPLMPSPPPGMHPFDPNNPMAAIMAMQAMGFPVPGMPTFPQPPSTGNSGSPGALNAPKKQRCRDYDTKGFCARGNTCMFEHGQDSIYVSPGESDEYDPSNSSLMTGVESSNDTSTTGFRNFNNPRGNGRGGGRGSQRGDRGSPSNNPSRRGGRAEFSSDRPNFDKTKTSIVVENIPEEKFSEDSVREFFSEFGNITEISMRPYKRLAVIKFDDWGAAKSAYSSPKVIFDNRFVKVYWYTNPQSLPQPPSVSTSNGAPKIASSGPNIAPARATSEPQIDIEEFSRKQIEVQKAHEEKMKKKQEMDVARKDLERRQEDLLKSQAEEKRKLMEKIAAKGGKLISSPHGPDGGTPATTTAKTSAQTEALKAQLAALEAEAQSLGIDTTLTDDTAWGDRGRGRGRGGYRGRGSFLPRGFRGTFRGGRGGSPFGASGGVYKLDNRTKKVALTGVDFSQLEKDESLRQYLLGIGEYSDIEITPERTSITFKDRFTAEKFMYGLPGGEVPSVGKVEVAWVQTSLPPIQLPIKSLAKADGPDDMAMDESYSIVNPSSPSHGGHGQEQQENIDYDVADDNDWGAQ